MKRKVLVIFLAMVLVVSLAALPACKAEEAPAEYSLKITAVGEGTTSPKPGTSTITEGESVTVTAIPDSGYKFDYWEGDVSGTTNPITFKMKFDMSVVAVFVEGVVVEEWEWPETLPMATDVMAGDMHLCSLAWGTELERTTGMKVRMIPEHSMLTKLRMARAGLIDFFASTPVEYASFGIERVGEYATREPSPSDTRIVWLGRSMYTGYMVRADSDIKTVSDIKGHKVGVCTLSPSMVVAMDGLLAWGDISWDEVTRVEFASWPANMRALTERKADVIYALTASPHTYEAAAAPHGIRFLDLDSNKEPEAAKRFLEVRPTLQFGQCAMGTKEALGLWMPTIYGHIFALEKTDPELVYHLCKWLDENYGLYKDKHETAKTISLENFRTSLDGLYFMIHEGTIKYLREKGMWTTTDDARQQANLDLIKRYDEAYQAAMDKADEQGIKIDPESKEWIELWENYKEELNLPRFRVIME